MSRDELMMRIQALSFAMTETQLFLDTHPECRAALDNYRRLADELDAAMAEYQNMHAAIVPEATAADRWSWVEGPWPWQNNGHNHMDMNKREGAKK